MPRKIAALVLVACLPAGCSGGGAADQPPPTEPTVSTPTDETPTPAMSDDFATAVKFTKAAHDDDFQGAADLALPESPAARYLAHQALVAKAQRLTGSAPADGSVSFKPDAAAGSITITWKDEETKTKTTSTWHNFTFDQGKLTGWTTKHGPVGSVLWTRTSSDSSRGVKAKLQSAYLSSSGNLWATVELSAHRARGFGDAEYAAKDGYRQTASEQYASDLAAGEKTLAYFIFDDAKFGGTLHLPYYDESGSSYGNWELKLKIK